MKKIIKRFLKIIALVVFSVLFLIGCLCVAWPFVAETVQEKESEQAISEFLETADSITNSELYDEDESLEKMEETLEEMETGTTDSASDDEEDTAGSSSGVVYGTADEDDYSGLLQAMQEYNEQIYEEDQSGLTDAWSYQQASFDLSDYGVDSEIVGYVTIPAMDSRLPIYLGATETNMKKGAVHLSQTSLPIGGNNTNCVLAAHRGYSGIPFWRDIEEVSIGDYVYVTNLWETLVYQVTEIEIIYPDDIDKILIQEGKDMLTLMTCHPYGGHGIYRYVVYCERTGTIDTIDVETVDAQAEIDAENNADVYSGSLESIIITPDDYSFVSSVPRIELEQELQNVGVLLIGIILIVLLIMAVRLTRPQKGGKRLINRKK